MGVGGGKRKHGVQNTGYKIVHELNRGVLGLIFFFLAIMREIDLVSLM